MVPKNAVNYYFSHLILIYGCSYYLDAFEMKDEAVIP
jgi:hypothetical protein